MCTFFENRIGFVWDSAGRFVYDWMNNKFRFRSSGPPIFPPIHHIFISFFCQKGGKQCMQVGGGDLKIISLFHGNVGHFIARRKGEVELSSPSSSCGMSNLISFRNIFHLRERKRGDRTTFFPPPSAAVFLLSSSVELETCDHHRPDVGDFFPL